MRPLLFVLFSCSLSFAAGSDTDSLTRFRRGADLTAPAAPDTRGELDDWELFEPGDFLERVIRKVSFLFVLIIIGSGALARVNGTLARERADSLRRVCFTCLLPAFLLRHIWLCQLDGQLYALAAWSFAFHGLWFALSVRASQALEPKDRQMRGWTMLMSQGAMNSFLYPLLLGNENFGEKSLACAVIWDLSGNMWICQFALFAIAAYFKPGALGDEPERELNDLDAEEEGESLLSKSKSREHGSDEKLHGGGAGKAASIQSSLQAIAEGVPREIIIDALQQPVLICCILGFVLNFFSVPLPAIADTPLWVIGEPYKIALYFLVGFYGDHRVGPNDINRMGRALGVRYAISASIILIVVAMLPFEQMYRYTVALALLSPTSSYLIHLVGEHGYGEGLLRLTVCSGFVSTLVSTIGQNMLMAVFNTML
mmetsp:Transcript_82833/g.208640  ORF Transcript_82833/g.208640 Transcript_82833/m.208640 type:complete len:427 (+) Transcript_82833:86-1366(+)